MHGKPRIQLSCERLNDIQWQKLSDSGTWRESHHFCGAPAACAQRETVQKCAPATVNVFKCGKDGLEKTSGWFGDWAQGALWTQTSTSTSLIQKTVTKILPARMAVRYAVDRWNISRLDFMNQRVLILETNILVMADKVRYIAVVLFNISEIYRNVSSIRLIRDCILLTVHHVE